MADNGQRIADGGWDRAAPHWFLRFLLRPTTRWAICWFIALGAAGFAAEYAYIAFDDPARADGNWGHASIDFGGQWVMGRALVEGRGHHLYNRNELRVVTQAGYPPGGEKPKEKNGGVEDKTDAENLLSWMAGADDSEAPHVLASFAVPLAARTPFEEAVLLARADEVWTPDDIEHLTAPPLGGGLYPPIHALIYAPVSLLPPRVAYRVVQALILALVFFDGWLVQRMTGGRVWWPVASLFIMIFPGFNGCISLGQNGLFSLTLVLAGWWQLMRGREAWAGVLWALLAFKPVWAVAFFLIPLLTRRWRMAAGMAGCGLAQIALTLPVVGWRTWLDWLRVGRMGAVDYTRQENWIFLSRDLLGLPRRWLLDFEGNLAVDVDNHPLPTLLGWSLWTVVFVLTLFVVWRGRRRMKALSGPAASFVLLGAIFSCYHFMYYDVMIAGLPVLLLLTEPRRYLQSAFWRWPNWLSGLVPPLLLLVMVTVPPLGCVLDPTYHFPPVETFALLLLWMWCGYRVLIDAGENVESVGRDAISINGATHAAKFAEFGADVGSTHERLADQHSADAGLL